VLTVVGMVSTATRAQPREMAVSSRRAKFPMNRGVSIKMDC